MIGFIRNMLEADKKNAQADRTNAKAFEKVAQAEAMVRQSQYDTRMSLEKLANRKRGIWQTSLVDFLRLYEQLIQIEFEEGEGIRELHALALPFAVVEEIRSMTAVAGTSMTPGQTIAVFLVGGISGLIRKEAEQNLTAASMRWRQANVIESQAETITVALDAIRLRADRISDLLTKLNILFRKSMEETATIIAERGLRRENYTVADRERLMTCINLAATLKTILDTKLLDENGEITAQSLEAIRVGTDYLDRTQQATL
jgi:hypothetical protein